MLLKAGYSKKVPTEIQYSTHDFFSSICVEIPDDITKEDEDKIRQKLRWIWRLTKEEAENQIKEYWEEVRKRREEHHGPTV